MSNWGRNYGRSRKCGKRRTSPDGNPVICSRVADGSHTEHRGRERTGWGVPAKTYRWSAVEPKATLEEVVP